jgi:hypothetical protein
MMWSIVLKEAGDAAVVDAINVVRKCGYPPVPVKIHQAKSRYADKAVVKKVQWEVCSSVDVKSFPPDMHPLHAAVVCSSPHVVDVIVRSLSNVSFQPEFLIGYESFHLMSRAGEHSCWWPTGSAVALGCYCWVGQSAGVAASGDVCLVARDAWCETFDVHYVIPPRCSLEEMPVHVQPTGALFFIVLALDTIQARDFCTAECTNNTWCRLCFDGDKIWSRRQFAGAIRLFCWILNVFGHAALQAKQCNGWTPLHDLMASGLTCDVWYVTFDVRHKYCAWRKRWSGGDAASCVAMLDGGADRAIRDAESHTSVYLMAE